MKRAEVWRDCDDQWHVLVTTDIIREPHRRITRRDWPVEMTSAPDDLPRFPTHAAALARALAEVGLTEKNTEKETNR